MKQRAQERSYSSKSPVSRPNQLLYLSPFSKQNYELVRFNYKPEQINSASIGTKEENSKAVDVQPLQFSCQRKIKHKQPQLLHRVCTNNENSSIFFEKNETKNCLGESDQNKKKRYLSVVSQQQKSRFTHINYRYEQILKEIKMIKSEKDMDKVVLLYKQKQQQLEKKCKNIEKERGYWVQMYLKQKERSETDKKMEAKLREEYFEYLKPINKQEQSLGMIGLVQQIVKLIKLWQNEMCAKSKQHDSLMLEIQLLKDKNEVVNRCLSEVKNQLERQKKQKVKLFAQVSTAGKPIVPTAEQSVIMKQHSSQGVISSKRSKSRSISASGHSHSRKHQRHRNGPEHEQTVNNNMNVGISKQRQVQNYKQQIKKLETILINQNQEIISEGLKKLNNKYRLKMYEYQSEGKEKMQKNSIIEQLKYINIKQQKYTNYEIKSNHVH